MWGEENDPLFDSGLAFLATFGAYLVAIGMLLHAHPWKDGLGKDVLFMMLANLWLFGALATGFVAAIFDVISCCSRVVRAFFVVVFCLGSIAFVSYLIQYSPLPIGLKVFLPVLPVIVFLLCNYWSPIRRLAAHLRGSLGRFHTGIRESLWLIWLVGVIIFAMAFLLRYGLYDDFFYGLVAAMAVGLGYVLNRFYVYVATVPTLVPPTPSYVTSPPDDGSRSFIHFDICGPSLGMAGDDLAWDD